MQFDSKPLSKLAHYDDLTLLPNRILFNEILNKGISQAKRHNKILAILVIDIDFLKESHVALGKEVLDKVIKDTSQRLTASLRTEDILARLEGDQFIVLLNDIAKAKFASSVAEKLLHAFADPIKADSQEFFIKPSIGISVYPNDGHSLEDLLKNADAALFKAKQAGGNIYQFYGKEIESEAREYIQLETSLRKAIKNNELALYYQPKTHLKNGNITGVEALMRWEHPELGIIQPGKFIPIAEDSGMIMEIGEWALRTACRDNKHWQDEGYEHFTVAVNISAKQFYHPEITQVIEKVLKETGLNPQYLELELPESTVMDNIESATNILRELKSTGIQLSIDHFGIGNTSISHLKQFPVSTVKIDKSFIKGVPNNPDDVAITNALIGLVHNLGLEAVAEGVETGEQVQYLVSQHCDIVQGYFLSLPLPADKIVLQFKKLMDKVLI